MCVFSLSLVIPIPVNATRIEPLREDKAALGALFGRDALGLVIEKNLGNYSDYPDEEIRLTFHIGYGDQVLAGSPTVRWTRLSDDFGIFGVAGIAGGYHTGYEDPLDSIKVLAAGGLFMTFGAVKPWVGVMYNYDYDTHFNIGEGVFFAGIGAEIDLSERLSVNIRGEGFTDRVNTHFTVSVIYHSWD